MKYGESTFDILYLIFAVVGGLVISVRARNLTERLMGFASLILGFGDAFHLVPRVLNYFLKSDFTFALGVGKLVTSVTMTVFYLLMYYIWLGIYNGKKNKTVLSALWVLSAVRVILCLFPQNGWTTNTNSMTWGIIRNIPFVIIGFIICILYFIKRTENRKFRFIWLYTLLSFLFYMPVAAASSVLPILGMLMLPKTICYILVIVSFLCSVTNEKPTKGQK